MGLIKKKERRKIIGTIIQIIILIILCIILFRAFFNRKTYIPDKLGANGIHGPEDKDHGFIALSYFGVDRKGTPTLISTKRLEEHLKALNQNGYVTISQQDIMNYYNNGKTLPENALFLMYEDGRKDTAIFASKINQKYNYLATILSYGEKLEKKDSAFLSPKDLKNLGKSTFWEYGTNGYRLSYINVFDRYDNYLGELTLQEFDYMRKYLGRKYNQYLMDYIRDEEDIPKETYSHMEERISNDYRLMDEIYTNKLGKLPHLYVLMHSNTGRFGNHERVSRVNEEWLTDLFAINFNREGRPKNHRETNIYDLTRMQPQPYWYPNHLLMRIKEDTEKDIIFIDGDKEEIKFWETIKGAPEFRENRIALTSEPKGRGLIKLKSSKGYKDITMSVNLLGNIIGIQRIYLRADENLQNAITIELKDNIFTVYDRGLNIYEMDLAEFDSVDFKSIREDQLDSLKAAEYLYSKNEKLSYDVKEVQNSINKLENLPHTDDNDYIPKFQINEAGNREIYITLNGDRLSIDIDGKKAIENLIIKNVKEGGVYLEAAFDDFGYSQRNIVDSVYDGVFEDIIITDAEGKPLYTNSYQGHEKVMDTIKTIWNNVVNWFIETL